MTTQLENEQRVNANELLAMVTAIFERCGMSERDAGLLSDSLVDADLKGVHSHGVLRVPEYIKKLTHDGARLFGLHDRGTLVDDPRLFETAAPAWW